MIFEAVFIHCRRSRCRCRGIACRVFIFSRPSISHYIAICCICWSCCFCRDCFRHRFERLTKLVAVLREDMLVMGSVRFTPEVICSCTTHVYMRGAAEDLEAIHEEVCADTGIRIWDHLRGPGFEARFASSDDDPWCYFEWTLGEHNMQIPDDVILDAWAEFGRRLHLWHKARQIKEKSPFLSCKISNANVHSIALNLQGSSINE